MIVSLLVSLCAPLARGDLADDQYTVAARHYSAGRWELAADEFRSFLEQYPDHLRAEAVRFFLAESLVQRGMWHEARAQFAEYLQRNPAGQFVRRATFRLGEATYLSGQYAAARGTLEQFRRDYPEDELLAYVLPYLGEIALVLEDPPAAQEAFSDALQCFPEGPLAGTARYGLARALEAVGDHAAAMRFYRFLAEYSPRSTAGDHAALQLAILQYDRGEYEACRQTLREHCERFPESELLPHTRYWLGMALLGLSDYRAAAETLEKAAEQYAAHELAYAMLFHAADAYRQGGMSVQAERACERSLTLGSASEWADDSLQMLVQLAWEAGQSDRVVTLAERFAAEFPDSPLRTDVEHIRARAAMKLERFDDAIRILESPLMTHATTGPGADLEPSSVPRLDSPPSPRVGTDRPSLAAANRYYLALAYLGAERSEEALRVLDAIPVPAGPAELVHGVHVARATALTNLGRLADAIVPLEACLATATRDEDADQFRAQLAVVLARLDQWPRAEAIIAQLRAAPPRAGWYLSTIECLAELAYRQQRAPLAERLFEDLSRAADSSDCAARGLSGLAWLAWQRGDFDATVAACGQLLERFPTSPVAAEAAVLSGQALERLARPQEALDLYQLVLARHAESPQLSTALLSAARIQDQLQRDDEAELLLRRWLEQFPASDELDAVLYQLAWVLIDQGRDAEADPLLERVHIEYRPGRYWADATYRLAERAARAAQLQRADQLAAEIVEAGDGGRLVSYALFLRGQLAAAEQRWDDVARWMTRVVVEFPDTTLRRPAQYWMAESHFRQRQFAEADRLLAQLQDPASGSDEPWLAMVALRRAQIQAHGREWDAAHFHARPIADRFPNFPQQHEVDYLLGRYFMSRGEFDQARAAYTRVIDSSAGRRSETAAMAQWMIGETHFMQQQYTEAIKAYHRVELLYTFPQWQAVALLQAGKCYEMAGRWSDAVQRYAQILNDYPSSHVADKATARMAVARQKVDAPQQR